MASTNKTTNYELSQYVGSDKPTYLGDYNTDMLKIDTQMKVNATAIETAQSTADTATTTANTALTNAGTAQTTADTANTTANSALNKALQNESDIASFNEVETYTIVPTSPHPTINPTYDLRREGKTVTLDIDSFFTQSIALNTWVTIGTISDTSIIPKEQMGVCVVAESQNGTIIGYGRIDVKTDGTIRVKTTANNSTYPFITASLTWQI